MTVPNNISVVWEPQPGSQTMFLTCPYAECLYEGTRGPGKTDALLMDFAQDVGKGFGSHWRGVLFALEYKHLDDVIVKSKRWFSQIFPEARFLKGNGDYKWIWPTGEELLLRAFKRPDDYWNYHGHEYPWQGWEELTKWHSRDCFDSMRSCSRSSYRGPLQMRIRRRATTNPYGVGHHWVKAYFIDPAPAGVPIKNDRGQYRVRIFGALKENRFLNADYINELYSVRDPAKRAAWLFGSWDIVSGGVFSDVWDEKVHVIKPFKIPPNWYIDRSFDWGSSKPFSVGWWAESDGSEVEVAPGIFRSFARGSIIRIKEWYGWDGENPNEGLKMLAKDIAKGIVEREKILGLNVNPGPADSSIYTTENGNCIADDMKDESVIWTAANKSPGSRINGWELMRNLMEASKQSPQEDKGIFVFNHCRQFIRTVPPLPRCDKNPDDVDTDAEDHIADEARYKALSEKKITKKKRMYV